MLKKLDRFKLLKFFTSRHWGSLTFMSSILPSQLQTKRKIKVFKIILSNYSLYCCMIVNLDTSNPLRLLSLLHLVTIPATLWQTLFLVTRLQCVQSCYNVVKIDVKCTNSKRFRRDDREVQSATDIVGEKVSILHTQITVIFQRKVSETSRLTKIFNQFIPPFVATKVLKKRNFVWPGYSCL